MSVTAPVAPHAAPTQPLLKVEGLKKYFRVRKALLRNPRFPEAAAVRLVGLLSRQDLEELAQDPKLPLRVLAALHRRLRPRS